MKRTTIIRWIRRGLVAVAVGVGVFFAVAFLPGSIEGNYLGTIDCMCDSVNFVRYTDGRLIVYSSNHPPAVHFGRYEEGPDGSIDVFSLPWMPDESEQQLYRAYPRLLVTKFVRVDDGAVFWLWKRPSLGKMKRAIDNHEIEYAMIHEDRIERTFYNNQFEVLRRETKPREIEEAEPQDEVERE